ncbi:hypothetical protein TSOC_009610 [Tetrabaena socialis]|uniref:Uncharacterized protein n=1 Tax=Tetrabaena socialis TaxID=47790 RepID=A0A2J7ZVC5_9CHLO|nr:hypothetical protein TSOC_009610 [Tetrabaena socialis]|eukprot:PNH04237.1 hypothetical protein TSOC_009610 [Tetrabaena socialis]
MSDKVLEQISESTIEGNGTESGSLLVRWLSETWSEAGRGVVQQFLVFYALMLVGFGFLFLMMRSTTQ